MERILALQKMSSAYADEAFLNSTQSNHCSSQSNDKNGCSSQSIECGGGGATTLTELEW